MVVHLQGVQPMTFEDLASKVTDNENYLNQLTYRRNFKFLDQGLDKGKKERGQDNKYKHVMETSVTLQHTEARTQGANSQAKDSRFNNYVKPKTLKERLKKHSFP